MVELGFMGAEALSCQDDSQERKLNINQRINRAGQRK